MRPYASTLPQSVVNPCCTLWNTTFFCADHTLTKNVNHSHARKTEPQVVVTYSCAWGGHNICYVCIVHTHKGSLHNAQKGVTTNRGLCFYVCGGILQTHKLGSQAGGVCCWACS